MFDDIRLTPPATMHTMLQAHNGPSNLKLLSNTIQTAPCFVDACCLGGWVFAVACCDKQRCFISEDCIKYHKGTEQQKYYATLWPNCYYPIWRLICCCTVDRDTGWQNCGWFR